MPNVRDYLRKKAERKEKKPNTHNFGDLILKQNGNHNQNTAGASSVCRTGSDNICSVKKPGIQQLYNPVLHRKTAV